MVPTLGSVDRLWGCAHLGEPEAECKLACICRHVAAEGGRRFLEILKGVTGYMEEELPRLVW